MAGLFMMHNGLFKWPRHVLFLFSPTSRSTLTGSEKNLTGGKPSKYLKCCSSCCLQCLYTTYDMEMSNTITTY